ncbi:MAG TPA: DJ-1/PfpI family protein [Stellaceae bacterium]|nr:DJ-1/PfpI family protein [Stellaceae bacterium]
MATDHLTVGLLLFPEMTQLDMTGPYEVFVSLPRTTVHLVWKTLEPVTTGGGLRMLPTTTLTACPKLDVICVPGGPGQVALMRDAEILGFLRKQAETSRFVTSVCTGSLVLGAAGLLRGYRATCHWLSLDQLALLGATPVAERIVMDGNRITGGGVTSGIDFALFVAAQLFGEDVAKEVQLRIEYDPAPPFNSGSPRTADPALVDALSEKLKDRQAARRSVTEEAARALGLSVP